MAFSCRTVAIVENHHSVRVAIASLLRSVTFAVEEFSSAEAFLADPGRHHASCLVVNVCLPGLNGFELLTRLVGEGHSPPTLFISADTRFSARVVGPKSGVAFLAKPFDAPVLLATVEALCSVH